MDRDTVIRILGEIIGSVERIRIQGSNESRLVFRDERAFRIFGKEVLNPWSDYTYEWTYQVLERVVEYMEENPEAVSLDEFRDEALLETIDCLVDVYTSDLTRWLHHTNHNVDYLTEVLEEYGCKDGFQALTLAQYKAIEETAHSACNQIEDLIKDDVFYL